jgi:glutamine amidotransferase
MSSASESGLDLVPVAVIDAGVGNLGNLRRALLRLGAHATVTAEPDRVAAARCLVLPGVGAFAPPREALRGELEAALREALGAGGWLLGVCVGYQLLFESSEEFGDTDGLALLPGRVGRLPGSVPLPHIGWNRLETAAADGAAGEAAGLLAGLPAESWVYFVHSFAPRDVPEELVLARTLHGRSFAAAAGRGRVMGTQFHPEKSGALGLAVLRNFLRLAGALPAAAPVPAAATAAVAGEA